MTYDANAIYIKTKVHTHTHTRTDTASECSKYETEIWLLFFELCKSFSFQKKTQCMQCVNVLKDLTLCFLLHFLQLYSANLNAHTLSLSSVGVGVH